MPLAAALLLAALPGCDRFEPKETAFDNKVYLSVAQTSNRQQLTYKRTLDRLDRTLQAMLSYPSDRDVSVTIAVDPTLVASYNTRYNTDYPPLDPSHYGLSGGNTVIEAGRVTSEPAVLYLTGLDRDDMEVDKVFLLPVTISQSSIDVLGASSTVYYLVKRSSAITTAAQLNTGNWMEFPTLDVWGPHSEVYNGIPAVTYEAFIYIDEYVKVIGTSDVHISSIMGVEQYMLLRIGDVNFNRDQLQFAGEAFFGKFPKSDDKKRLYTNQWYHIACTYDMEDRTVAIYVNGELQSGASGMGPALDDENRMNLAMRALYDLSVQNPGMYPDYETYDKAYQFFIGRSYNDDRPLQGKIAEARVWSVARTQQEIRENMYGIENPADEPALLGYWKFDEGTGNTVTDHTGRGNHAIAHTDLVWPEGIEIPRLNQDE